MKAAKTRKESDASITPSVNTHSGEEIMRDAKDQAHFFAADSQTLQCLHGLDCQTPRK